MMIVPEEWINDGYCNCPLDGIDEPDTNAWNVVVWCRCRCYCLLLPPLLESKGLIVLLLMLIWNHHIVDQHC